MTSRLGFLLSEDSSEFLQELADMKQVTPHQMLDLLIKVVYFNRHLFPSGDERE